ncbi:MAG TPA: hypothetical protein VH309_12640, partial [Elusimicrobiota bacterium]|nr:hypothetical protein [Elusimicrobiota bacterium]
PGSLRRMISPGNLLDQVRTTAPFLFEGEAPAAGGPRGYIRRLRDYGGGSLSPSDYYLFCLSAHWATAGTFVPTDVDNAIRWKLWQDVSPNLAAAQAELVLEALGWDYTPVTARVVRGPKGELLSTHEGTWFSVAVGAYAGCREKRPEVAAKILAAMGAEAERERAVFSAIADQGDGVSILKASALIAHNFGDLDRVADQWELSNERDPLKKTFYDAAKPGTPLFGGLLGWAGALNRKFLSADNHRHYPLREPRGLRRAPELLIPVGPFFDDWGRAVARHPALSREDVADVVRALLDGWARLHGPVGYARALAGILEVFPGGRSALGKLLPGADRRLLESGPIKAAMDIDQTRFEAQWANRVRQVPRPKAELKP